jgi:pilus assembly protein CpaF
MMTIHANNAEEALERLAMLLVFNLPGAPVYYVPRLIGSSLDLVVQQNRLPDGSRKVTGITEVVPDRQEGYTLRDIAVFKQTGLNERGGIAGAHQVYPLSERLAQRLRNLHITLPPPFMLPDSPQPTG